MATCSTSARATLQRSCSADVFKPQRPRAGPRRLSRAASRAMSLGWEGDQTGERLHEELQRAVAEYKEYKAQQEAKEHAAASSAPRPMAASWDFEEAQAEYYIPWPANLPTNPDETEEAAEALQPLEFYPTSQQLQLNWGVVDETQAAGPSPHSASHIYVILFGVGESDTEGIYTLRAVAKENGLPVDTVVAFECATDAERYACLLEASMVHKPTVLPYEWGEMLDFCNESGYRLRLERSGSLMIPPDYNVGVTDWEKTVRLRNGEFWVLEVEPDLVETRSPFAAGGTGGTGISAFQQQYNVPPFADPSFLAAEQRPGQQPFSQQPFSATASLSDAFGLETAEWMLGPPTWALDACLEEEQESREGSSGSEEAAAASSAVDSQLADPVQLQLLRQQLERLLPRD